jgi:hypothetical protein
MLTLFRLAFRLALLGITAAVGVMAVTLATLDLSAFVSTFARTLAEASGLPVSVAGGASVQYLPKPGIVLENVTVGTGGAGGLAQTPRVVLELDPVDLALGELNVVRVVAENPDIVVERDPDKSGEFHGPPLSHLFGADTPGTEVVLRGGNLTVAGGPDGSSITVPLGGGDDAGLVFTGGPTGPGPGLPCP